MRSTRAANEGAVAPAPRNSENARANALRGEDPIDPEPTNIPTLGRPPAAAVVMGVSGSGKTTIGKALAERFGWEFVDGDDLHPASNVAKMHAAQPLDDDDRAPWLDAIAGRIDAWHERGVSGVVTCSALKRRYRQRIVGVRSWVRLIYLDGSRELIAERLAARRGHFMPASLLDSQFAALEPPAPDEHAIAAPIDRPVAAIVDAIVTALSSPPANMATTG
jgi:gluconokinase